MIKEQTYGAWLVTTRKPRGISQERLATLTGIDRGHLSKIETGRVDLPSYETRQRIHAALGTTEDELIALGIVRQHTIHVPAATAHGEAHAPTVTVAPSEAHNPFERGTWHWVVMQRVRQMDDAQAEDVASFAEYILTRKKTELPVIVRGAKAPDRVAP